MTDEKIRVQIVASANGAHVDSTQGGVRKTIGRYKCTEGIAINFTRCTDKTRLAIMSALVNAAVEADRLEKHLNAPPEPPALTLRAAAENLLDEILLAQTRGKEIRQFAIKDLQGVLNAIEKAEGGDE